MKDIEILHTGLLGVNTCVVRLEGSRVFVVDPAACEFCGDAALITDFLHDEGLEPVAVVLTHGHFDHVSGLPALRSRYPDIPIYIHRLDASFIGRDSALRQGVHLALMDFAAFVPVVSNLPEATAFLEDGEAVFDGWRVLHTPGHTEGCCCLYNAERKCLISGDTLFYHSFGRTDLPGGDERAMKKSLRRLSEELPLDTLVYPGHERYAFPLVEGGRFW